MDAPSRGGTSFSKEAALPARHFKKAESTVKFQSNMINSIVETMIKSFVLELCYETFKTQELLRLPCTHCGTHCRHYVQKHGHDIYGAKIDNHDANGEVVECLLCAKRISASRFASHLEKCMGIGGRSGKGQRTSRTSGMPISSTNVQFGVGNSGGSLADRNSITPYYGLDVQLDEESDEGNISESDTSTSYSTSLKFDGSDRQKSSNFSHKDTRFTQPNRNAGGGLLSTVNSAGAVRDLENTNSSAIKHKESELSAMLSSANEHVKNINRMKVDEENTPDVKDKSLVKRSILGGIAKASLATNAVLTNSKIAPKINRRSLLGDITNSAVKKQKTPSNFKSPFEIAVTKSSAKRTTPNLERTLSISGGSTYVASRLRITWNAEDEEIDYCSTLSTLDENQPTYTDTDLASDIQRRMQADCSDPEESPRVEENSGRVLSAVKLSNEWLQIQKNAREIAFEPLPFPRSEDYPDPYLFVFGDIPDKVSMRTFESLL